MSLRLTLFLLSLLAVGVLGDIPRRSYIASFGSNDSNRLGRDSSSARPVVGLTCPKQRCGIRQFSVANNYAIASTALGDYAWGSNEFGQLPGIAPTSEPIAPTLVPPIAPLTTNSYLVMDDACFMNAASTTYGYGSNSKGQLAAIGHSDWSEEPVVVPVGVPASKRSYIASHLGNDANGIQSSDHSGDQKRSVDGINDFKDALSSPYFANQNGTLSFAYLALRCAATRCYYQNATHPYAWGYWGAADYDSSYDWHTTPLRSLAFNSSTVTWIVHSRTTAIAKTASGVWSWGFFLNSTDPLYSQPPTLLTPACTVRPRLPLPLLSLSVDIGDGFVVYVCNDARTVYTFGNNTFGQLGNASITEDYIPGIIDGQSSATSHAMVTIPFTSETDVILDLATGKATTYVLTSSGDIFAWGYAGEHAMGAATSGPTSHPTPILLPYYSSVSDLYLAVAIRATSSAHGVFAGLAMRPGTIGQSCAVLPAIVGTLFNLSDANSIFCDIQGFYNLNTMAMESTEQMFIDFTMKIRGDMAMSGTSKMYSIGGMSLEGDIDLNETAQAIISGYYEGSANLLDGSLSLADDSQVHLGNTSVLITGEVNLAQGASLNFNNLSSALLNESSVVVNVTGNVVVNGTLNVVLTQEDVDILVEAVLAGYRSDRRANEPGTSTTPGNLTTVNATLTTTLVTSGKSITTSSSTTTGIIVAQPSNPCASSSGSLVSSGPSLTTIVTISVSEGCTPSTAGKFGKDSKTTAIIAGSVVGGVIALFIVAAIVVFAVKPIRNRVLPYRHASARRAALTTRYTRTTEA